jgi:hypothetical protein
MSLGALTRMRLHDRVSDILFHRLRLVGPIYTGIHIRNTDLKSNYLHFVRDLANQIAGPIFLATDNQGTLAECRSILGEHRVYSFSELPSEPGQRLHCANGFTDRFQVNADSILDLVMLGLSTDYYAAELARPWPGWSLQNGYDKKYSGYSQLAADLHTVRPLLSRMIVRRDRTLEALLWPFGLPQTISRGSYDLSDSR